MTSKKMAFGLHCCYAKHIGWPARRIMTNPILTAIIGEYMNTPMSLHKIDRFVRTNHIDMSEYRQEEYHCFNDFFTRRIKPEARPINNDKDTLISPCDGALSAYRISSDSVFSIKNSYYNVDDLVGGAPIADDYMNGVCLVLRLGVENYHRYCYIDDGYKSSNRHIKGRYHTVQPIAVRKHPVFVQNTREYCIMHTENFGPVVQIEVGACLVGKIDNYQQASFIKRGSEKGRFLFGGSTIVLLFKDGVLDLPQRVFNDTLKGREQPVMYGKAICKKLAAK